MAPSVADTNGASEHAAPDVEMKDFPTAPAPTEGVATPAAAPATPQSRPAMAPPSLPNPHGAQARIYLNKNVTPHLLEGVKYLALNRPDQPLKWLSDFLAKKSEELEG